MGVIRDFFLGLSTSPENQSTPEAVPTPAEKLEERRAHFQSLVDNVTYPTYEYLVKTGGGAIYLVIRCVDTCNMTGDPMVWNSGKWLLSPHMLDSEIVQKCLKATLTAVEHEAREQFRYRGRSIFDPHLDVEKLWEFRGLPGAVVQRTHPTSSESLTPPKTDGAGTEDCQGTSR